MTDPDFAALRARLQAHKATTRDRRPSPDDADENEIIAAGLCEVGRQRQYIAYVEKTRDEQPQRLAAARAEADDTREQSMFMELWAEQLSALRAYTRDGQLSATSLTLPSMPAKEMFGVRLAFDVLDCADDDTGERVNDVLARVFTMTGGDTGQAMLIMASALDTIATHVMPTLLDEIEQRASNWDARVLLAEARTNAWRGSVVDAKRLWDEIQTDD